MTGWQTFLNPIKKHEVVQFFSMENRSKVRNRLELQLKLELIIILVVENL